MVNDLQGVAAGDRPAPEGVIEDAPPTEQELRVAAVNAFLSDAGIVGLRLLRADGLEDGHLLRAIFELRNDQGYPIGFHDAARARFRVDPATMKGALVFEGGATVVRGVRSAFPGGSLDIDIPAVAPGSYTGGVMAVLTEVVTPAVAAAAPAETPAPIPVQTPVPAPNVDPVGTDVVEITSTTPEAPAPVAAVPAVVTPPPFDPAPLLAGLNDRLRLDGGGRLEFGRVTSVGASGLQDVIAHHYGPSGQLSKTVVARTCGVEMDERDREIVLRFVDGHHVTRGREVPFFRGRGADHGIWTYRLRGADLDRWRAWAAEFGL